MTKPDEALLWARENSPPHIYVELANAAHAYRAGGAASEARIKALEARVAAFEHELKRLEPYLDAIICYASTRSEHEPNDIVFSIRALLEEADQ